MRVRTILSKLAGEQAWGRGAAAGRALPVGMETEDCRNSSADI